MPADIWYIEDGDLPYRDQFPEKETIEEYPVNVWKITDGELPDKASFPLMRGITDAPSRIWFQRDGDLPYKLSFPPMYPVERPAAAPKPPYFTFKGIDSTEFGIMEMDPLCLKNEQKTNFLYMPTQGVSVMETGTYKSKVITMTLGLTDISPENILRINQWLVGQGPLIFSRDPKRYYIASCNGALTGQRILRLGKLPIQFNVMPFKYKLNDEFEKLSISTILIAKLARIDYEGNVNGQPKIKVYVDESGDVDIRTYHSDNITIKDVTEFVEIDVPARKVYDANGNVILNKTYGDITTLQLEPGENTFVLSDNVNDIRVKRNVRWY